jgi:hypothetical protein
VVPSILHAANLVFLAQLAEGTAFHFLHDPVVVSQYHSPKFGELLRLHPGDEMGKGSVQTRDTVSESELVDDEAIYYVSGLALVDFHCTLEYTPYRVAPNQNE